MRAMVLTSPSSFVTGCNHVCGELDFAAVSTYLMLRTDGRSLYAAVHYSQTQSVQTFGRKVRAAVQKEDQGHAVLAHQHVLWGLS